MTNPADIVYSPNTLGFIKTAREFCAWAEQSDYHDKKSAVERGIKIILLLYSYMMNIPESEPIFEEGVEKFVTEQDWSEVYQRMSQILGNLNEYTDVAGKDEYDRSDTVNRYISEDIADIYQEIKDCLENYVMGTEEVMYDALFECRSGFENHWGEKVLRAAFQLHRIFFSDNSFRIEDDSSTGDNNRITNMDNWFLSRKQKEFRNENNDLSE